MTSRSGEKVPHIFRGFSFSVAGYRITEFIDVHESQTSLKGFPEAPLKQRLKLQS